MEAFGRRQSDAVESLTRSLQQALSCVTNAVLIKEFTLPGQPQIFTTGRSPVRLSGVQSSGLATLIAFDVAPSTSSQPVSWAARIVGYAYELLAADDRMVLAYHWHSTGRSPVTWPHLHIGASIAGTDLRKAHVPAGAVTLQEVLRFAIVDCGVRTLRNDWSELLERTGD